MAKIGTWSTTPASNNQAVPDGWPEGQAPSTLNNCARQDKADFRTYANTAEWLDWGDTVSYASATTFKITGNVTSEYTTHRRIKCFDTTTLHATIMSSSYSAPDTTVTLVTDAGALSASLSSVALSAIRPTNISVPSSIGRKGTTIASAGTTDIGAADADFIDISGTTTITAFGTIAAGVERTVRFTGILTLTYNATSLILPSAANITTAANDTAIFRSLGSGNWLCISYNLADGTNLVSSGGGSGSVLQAKTTLLTSAFSLSLTNPTFTDITGLTVAIKPASVASRFYITTSISAGGTNGASTHFYARILRDSTNVLIGDSASSRVQATFSTHVAVNDFARELDYTVVDSPSTTATINYKVQLTINGSGTTYINRANADADTTTWARTCSSITVLELVN